MAKHGAALMLMHTRGNTFGRCNICGSEGKLTDDHTPPKGIVRVKQVELHHITARLSRDAPEGKHRKFQGGVKYRTLCQQCNNELGSYDDPALIEFSQIVHGVMTSTWPVRSRYVQPQNIMRSVIGHLCAQGVDRYGKGKITELLGWYITDRRTTLPTSIEVYWWPYPYRDQVVVRDAAFMELSSGHPVSVWIMKFFPLAFLVVFNRPRDIRFKLNDLSAFRDCNEGERCLMQIDCTLRIHQYWPEAPSGDSIVLYGPEAGFARESNLTASK